jgi:hypothetical protein
LKLNGFRAFMFITMWFYTACFFWKNQLNKRCIFYEKNKNAER